MDDVKGLTTKTAVREGIKTEAVSKSGSLGMVQTGIANLGGTVMDMSKIADDPSGVMKRTAGRAATTGVQAGRFIYRRIKSKQLHTSVRENALQKPIQYQDIGINVKDLNLECQEAKSVLKQLKDRSINTGNDYHLDLGDGNKIDVKYSQTAHGGKSADIYLNGKKTDINKTVNSLRQQALGRARKTGTKTAQKIGAKVTQKSAEQVAKATAKMTAKAAVKGAKLAVKTGTTAAAFTNPVTAIIKVGTAIIKGAAKTTTKTIETGTKTVER